MITNLILMFLGITFIVVGVVVAGTGLANILGI